MQTENLLLVLFCQVDDWIKARGLPRRPGPVPQCVDSEILTFALAREMLGYDGEAIQIGVAAAGGAGVKDFCAAARPRDAGRVSPCNTTHMAERTYYPIRRTPPPAALSALAVPSGAAAIHQTFTLANAALLGCFPAHLRTPALADRFITPARVHPVPQQELGARQRAEKPSDRMAIFGLVLTAGLPRKDADDLAYGVRYDTTVYANSFLPSPELFVDERLYRLFFSPDRGEREHAICMLGRAVIDVNLAAAPQVRVLPQDPWQALVQDAVEHRLLPSVRRLLDAAGTSDDDRFTTLVASVRHLLRHDEARPAPATTDREEETKRLINVLMNAVFGDDQAVEAVAWEPSSENRLVAHGAKVLLQRPDQVLPLFEFGTGVELNNETRTVFTREAVLAFYTRLQQRGRLPIVARHEGRLRDTLTALPQVYLELGLTRSGILEHYVQSTIPDWYREQTRHSRQQPAESQGHAARYPQ